MQVHRSIDSLPPFRHAVITIGTFDGVHEGHKKIIEALKREAAAVKGESIIVSFDPHPRKIVNPSGHLQLINTLEEKTRLLDLAGIDHLVIVPFTQEFAALTADEYIASFLVGRFKPHTIIIGYDHHFGKGRQGNFSLLEQQSSRFGYRLLEIPKYILDEIGVSSTKIRKALLESRVETAGRLLGYDFFFEGIVVHGDKLGRQLGYPTANLRYTDEDKIRLGHGVYAVYVDIEGERRKGMLSIGDRPTLTGSDERIEVNIFDWSQDIYDQKLRVFVKKFLRPQEKYATLDALKEQLALDKKNSLDALS
ncbi:MAG TPA: riboflavin biosynthesis protein RibF [Flavisolibacter sp.]|nr:riboflavin biosynthesis protein RibF [Flavisolibacter sp.]